MTMYLNHKHLIKLLSLFLCLTLLVTQLPANAAQEQNIIYIHTVDDWQQFVQNCRLNTWSQSKAVLLSADLDFTQTDFLPVPTFGGSFDGQNHTISGLQFNQDGSNQGLFRYIQTGAAIKNLNVSGAITPGGSQNHIGGIAGNNRGTIQNCTFTGNVSGKSNVGGIAGINEASGQILDCTVKGLITGAHYTGGIAGQNLGTISDCTNHSGVNLSVAEITFAIEDLNWEQINATENARAHTDTGGIAGFSSGLLQRCTNRDLIGYQHMGYNVGGIAGRQSGLLLQCINYGTVLGRKDVAGIAGQVEPYLELHFTEDKLQKLQHELHTMQQLMEQLVNHTEESSMSASEQISAVIASIDKTRDAAEEFTNQTADYINGATDTVNTASQRLHWTLTQMIPILEQTSALVHSMSETADELEIAWRYLAQTADSGNASADALKEAFSQLRHALQTADNSLKNLINALRALGQSIGEDEATEAALLQLKDSLHQLVTATQEAGDAFAVIAAALNSGPDSSLDWAAFIEGVQQISLALQKISDSITNIEEGIATVMAHLDQEQLQAALHYLETAIDQLHTAVWQLSSSAENTSKALHYLGTAASSLGSAFRQLASSFDSLKEDAALFDSIVGDLQSMITHLVAEPALELPKIESSYRESGEQLFQSLQEISAACQTLNEQMQTDSQILFTDLRAINDQIFKIFDLFLQLQSEEPDVEPLIEDISSRQSADAHLGTIDSSTNYGKVEGDVNVGGIAGSMAVEYDLDPEDDIIASGKTSLHFQYRTTAVLRQCFNYGTITAKKNYSGGVTGRMDLGAISGCINYGNISSTNGDYIGGIAGASYGSIVHSYALCTLSGRNYIGGIAGYGNQMTDNGTLIQIDLHNEWIGAIAGDAQGTIRDNYFVSEELGAIDGISYSGQAVPVTYEQLLQNPELPKEFSQLQLTFTAEDQIIEIIPFQYGARLSAEELPMIPFKEGYDSSWPDFNYGYLTHSATLEAIYTPLQMVISALELSEYDTAANQSEDEQIQTKPAKLLAEGLFHQNTLLYLRAVNPPAALPEPLQKPLTAWHIWFEGTAPVQKTNTLHIQIPEGYQHVTIWQLDHNGSWQQLSSQKSGNYQLCTFNGSNGTLCIAAGPVETAPLRSLLSILLFSVMLLLALWRIRNYKHIRKKEHPQR